jgi:GTP-binding protein Era
MATPFKSGFIAIVGPPNVGKSTLLNALIGEKVSIVTSKPQTTRNRILGIKNLPQGQLIFLDTPGIHPARKKFNVRLVEVARGALRESDIVLLMVEAIGPIPEEAFSYAKKSLQKIQKPIFLLINKIDLIDKRELLPLIETYRTLFPFREIVPVSALTGSGIEELEKSLLDYVSVGPQFFPDEMYTDQTQRFLAAEIIREKAFMMLQKEVLYSLAVEVREFSERKDDVIFIRAALWVEKQSQKGILIGKQGRMLKEIGRRSRQELEKILHAKVYLDLWVTVKKGWTVNDATIRQSLMP